MNKTCGSRSSLLFTFTKIIREKWCWPRLNWTCFLHLFGNTSELQKYFSDLENHTQIGMWNAAKRKRNFFNFSWFLEVLISVINRTKIFPKSLIKHTIRKVKFLHKNSILTKPQHFHEFFTQIFFDNFSREIKVVNS